VNFGFNATGADIYSQADVNSYSPRLQQVDVPGKAKEFYEKCLGDSSLRSIFIPVGTKFSESSAGYSIRKMYSNGDFIMVRIGDGNQLKAYRIPRTTVEAIERGNFKLSFGAY
jgi:hypothetical protein